MADSRVYWAAEKISRECVEGALARIKNYQVRLKESGRLAKMRRALSTYYGNSPTGDKDTGLIRQAGEAGELAELTVNQFAQLVQQALVLITSSKPVFRPIAINSDAKSGAQAMLTDGLLDIYERKLSVSDKERHATRISLIMGEGFVFMPWNPALGDAYGVDPDTEKQVNEGDIEIEVKNPFQVAYDSSLEDWDAAQWIAVRRQANRWDLAELYPQVREEVLSSPGATPLNPERGWDSFSAAKVIETKDIDVIDYWELHHKPTPACPNGRLLKFISADVVMFDTYEMVTSKLDGDWGEAVYEGSAQCVDHGYPYDEIPVNRVTSENVIGENAGHTAFFDLTGPQQGLDLVATISATAVNAGGLQNWYLPDGHNLTVHDLAGGMKLLTGPSAPVAITNVKIDPAILEFSDRLQDWMRQRVAINDVVLGEPSKGMPAQAQALMRAQALEFYSGTQASYERLLEKDRTLLIKTLRRYANGTRVAVLAGKSKTWALKEFTGKDLVDVDRVMVEPMSPAARTFAGRLSVVQHFMDMGAIKHPDQLLNFYATGRLDPILDGPSANLIRLAKWKEMIQQGIGVQPKDEFGNSIPDGKPHIVPLPTDTPWVDIPEIASVVATQESRDNPEQIAAALGVIQEQIRLWEQNPQLAVIMGGQPIPPSMTQPPMGGNMSLSGMPTAGSAAPPSMTGAPVEGEQNLGEGPRSGPPAEVPQGAPSIRLPKPPQDPLSGVQPPAPEVGAIQ